MPLSICDDDPIDVLHLRQMTLGDASVENEVLTMFSAQSAELIGALATLLPDAANLAHKLKGSARAIGAFHVAEAVENFEAALRDGDTSAPLDALQHAVERARAAIEAMLRRR